MELGPSTQSPCVKEEWVELGRMQRVSINGMDLCFCNLAILVGKLKSFLPADGWELSESIAPGVFGCQAKTASG